MKGRLFVSSRVLLLFGAFIYRALGLGEVELKASQVISPDTPFHEDCSSLDCFMPFSRRALLLRSSTGIVCPAPLFVRNALRTEAYTGMEQLLTNDSTLPNLTSLLVLRRDGVEVDLNYLRGLTDYSVIFSSMMLLPASFTDAEYRDIYATLFRQKPVTLDAFKYLNWAMFRRNNPSISIDDFLNIIFDGQPNIPMTVDYFSYWITDGALHPVHLDNFAVEGMWVDIFTELLSRLTPYQYFNMNLSMKRGIQRASYGCDIRVDFEALKSDIKASKNVNYADPELRQRLVLLDPPKAILELGEDAMTEADLKASLLECTEHQKLSWITKNVPDLKTMMLNHPRLSIALGQWKKQKHQSDSFFLLMLTCALSRQNLNSLGPQVFEGFNHILVPFPYIWNHQPYNELAKYFTHFDFEEARTNSAIFKPPILLLQAFIAALGPQSYIIFEKAFYDHYLAVRDPNYKNPEKPEHPVSPTDVNQAQGLDPNAAIVPQNFDSADLQPAAVDEGAIIPKAEPMTDTVASSSEGLEAQNSGAQQLVAQEAASDPPVASMPSRAPNTTAKGDPESFLLYYVLPVVEALKVHPHYMKIILDAEETMLLMMERNERYTRPEPDTTDFAIRLYFKVIQTLESLVETYTLRPLAHPSVAPIESENTVPDSASTPSFLLAVLVVFFCA